MKLYIYFLRYSPRLLLFATLVGGVAGGTAAALIALTNASLTGHARLTGYSVTRFGALVLILVLSNYVSRILVLNLANRLMLDLRLLFCRQLVSTPLRELEELGKHGILATLTADITNLADAFRGLPALCINIALITGCVIYLATLSPSILLFSGAYVLLVFLSCLVPEARAKRFLARAREEWNRVLQHFEAMIEGMMQLKLHGPRREAFLSGPLAESVMTHWRYSVKGERIYALIGSWMEAQYFILWGSAFVGMTLFGAITAPNFFAFALTLLYLRTPIFGLVEMLPALAKGKISLQNTERMGLSLQTLPSMKRSDEYASTLAPSRRSVCASFQRLDLKNIGHKYYREKEARDFVLGPIDLTIWAGELVFMKGSNGSGKTTLVKLLTGLYTAEAGEVRINGQLITAEKREWYQQHFTAVLSDYCLFETLLGLASVGQDLDRTARELLTKLELDRQVTVNNGRLSTVDLSRGQRKRLTLLNAFLEDRTFYVFDEWAADQDPVFKEVFYYQCLSDLKARGKTVFVVSHDDRYYHVADRILTMESGKLTETGSVASVRGSCQASQLDLLHESYSVGPVSIPSAAETRTL
jgi:putative ATP-binding cassette transporter